MVQRDLLAVHKTVAQFKGVETQQCFHMTALCPDECGHGGITAVFNIHKYLHYEKPGEYGDEKCEDHYVRVDDPVEETGLTPETKLVFDELRPGDFVLLSWNHDYVHYDSCSVPERPITKLVKISEDEAKKM